MVRLYTKLLPDCRQFQPFTRFTETLRGLLLGTEIGGDGIMTLAWCTAITTLSYLAAVSLYNRDPSP
jgi:ABC-2 type transport system permease protein